MGPLKDSACVVTKLTAGRAGPFLIVVTCAGELEHAVIKADTIRANTVIVNALIFDLFLNIDKDPILLEFISNTIKD